MVLGLKPRFGSRTELSQEASQGKRWDSHLGTTHAQQHYNPAKQHEEAKSKQTRSNDQLKSMHHKGSNPLHI